MEIDQNNYDEKKKRELGYYSPPENKKKNLFHKLLLHPLFYSSDRILYNYIFPKQQLASAIERRQQAKPGMLLDAPCGTGDDYKYFTKVADSIIGLDLSTVALSDQQAKSNSVAGDILQLPFPDSSFDIVTSPLFFHHLLKFGFTPFLNEFYRVLKPGGGIFILEPSLWYPLNIITRPIKRLFKNPFNEVEDEDPFPPRLLLQALQKVGFSELGYEAASFSHPVFHVPLANFVNRMSKPLLPVWPWKNFAWMIVFWGFKI
jgi:SAM-dependent methyltransferase